MQLRTSGALLRIVAFCCFLWLALLFALSFDDHLYRTPAEALPLSAD